MSKGFRTERDSLGEVLVPDEVYYGASTARAIQNFQISGLRFPRELIRAIGLVKYAAAKANMELGLIEERIARAIMSAARELSDGKFDEHIVVDVFQTGSGTSFNMNVNEVIASRASELLGGIRSAVGLVHPNDHVNMGQSTNDVFPTAMNVAVVELTVKELLPSLEILERELSKKAEEFKDIVKAGRTHLRDALPVTLGQEFSGYATMVRKGRERVVRSLNSLKELPIGGTAVGTGLNTHPMFPKLVIDELNALTGLGFMEAENRFESMGARDGCVEFSGSLKVLACSILKICNDLRLLYSGPNTGFNEIDLPALQAGSSIMPGKVNPVILEAVCQASVKVISNDNSITLCSQLGELELNMGMPLMAYDILQSIKLMSNATKALAEKCISGITANVERCRLHAESSAALLTILAPSLGYEAVARIVNKMLRDRRSIREALVEELGMNPSEVDRILDFNRLTRPGILKINKR